VHEYSLVQALLEQVERTAQAHRAQAVHRVHLRVGQLSGVEIPLLATAYEAFRARSACAQAELEIHPVAARWDCPGCARVFAAGERLRCPDCDLPAALAAGDEIVLERIELEVA
jgi:hydrogenase nickel incorporation protein HypA/HybF